MHIAKQILAELGQQLVGKTIITMPMGLWPGGAATITELEPEPNAPEIAFFVRHTDTGEEIGIFDDELVALMEGVPA